MACLSLTDHRAEPRNGQAAEAPLIRSLVNIRAEHIFGVSRDS